MPATAAAKFFQFCGPIEKYAFGTAEASHLLYGYRRLRRARTF